MGIEIILNIAFNKYALRIKVTIQHQKHNVSSKDEESKIKNRDGTEENPVQ